MGEGSAKIDKEDELVSLREKSRKWSPTASIRDFILNTKWIDGWLFVVVSGPATVKPHVPAHTTAP